MRNNYFFSSTVSVYRLAFCFMLCALYVTGCIRLSGAAGYTHIKDDKVITKSTGFDVDSARLIPASHP